MIIGFSGYAQVGKDTAADILKEWLERSSPETQVTKIGYADIMKWSAARLFHPEISKDDAVQWANEIKLQDSFITLYDGTVMSGRQFLQRYGTESHRDIFGDYFWVDQLISYTKFNYLNDIDSVLLIPDVRFENEAEVLDLLVYIVRPGHGPGDHVTERPLINSVNPDIIIYNDKDKRAFRKKVLDELLPRFTGLQSKKKKQAEILEDLDVWELL
jgi:hypothetical protein